MKKSRCEIIKIAMYKGKENLINGNIVEWRNQEMKILGRRNQRRKKCQNDDYLNSLFT